MAQVVAHGGQFRPARQHKWVEIPWGCHSVALFRYEISEAVARLAQLFSNPPDAPTSFSYRTIATAFDVWDWKVSTDPSRALEFIEMRDASRSGLTLIGSGKTTVTTPRLYNGASPVTITINGAGISVPPDKDGRLTFVVDLGPANAQQQYTLGATSPMSTAVVRFY